MPNAVTRSRKENATSFSMTFSLTTESTQVAVLIVQREKGSGVGEGVQKFDFSLTDTDIERTTMFMMRLSEDHKEFWSSDDFRGYSLHEDMTAPDKEIGAYFAKLKANGVAVPVGEVPSEITSNNKRKVDLWRFDWERWRSIIHGRLEVFA